jgi:hypothetical protein
VEGVVEVSADHLDALGSKGLGGRGGRVARQAADAPQGRGGKERCGRRTPPWEPVAPTTTMSDADWAGGEDMLE